MSNLQKSMSTVLLIGASGKIGLEIRKAFAAHGGSTTIICGSRERWKGQVFPNENWVQFDPLTGNWPAIGNIDVVINAIGAIAESKEMPFERIHGGVTAEILNQRSALGQPRIVQISAIGADSSSSSDFLRTKGQADSLLLDESETVVLRPSIVCTPDTMLSQKLRKLLTIARFGLGKMLVPTGFPHTRVQPVMGADVGEAALRAALNPEMQGIIDVVGPESIRFGELLERMATAQDRKIRLIEVSREIMESFVAHFVGVWFPNLINLEQFKLLFQDNVGDAAATEALLGRKSHSTWPFWEAEARGTEFVEADAQPSERQLLHVAVE